MNGEEAAQAVGRAKRALAVAQNDGNAVGKMPGTTTGHLFRGSSSPVGLTDWLWRGSPTDVRPHAIC